MQYPDLFEVSGGLHALMEFAPLTLEDINLQVVIEVVNQKAHVHTQLHSLPKHRFHHQMLHAPHFLRPHVLELDLNPFHRQQKPVDGVVFLKHVGGKDKVQRPLASVAHRKPRPWVLLVRLDV